LISGALSAFWSLINTTASPEARNKAACAAISSARDRPEWATFLLVQALQLIRKNPVVAGALLSAGDCYKTLNLLTYSGENGPQAGSDN
jgi:hypothetical protein